VAISSTAALTVVEGLLVLIAPVSVNGRVFHRVLLGPATDSASAEALATRVAQEVGISRSEWIVRATPVAFLLGEIPNQDAATRRVAVLRGLNVQAYMLAVDFADGSVRYRVYAGAYADSEEASYLQSHLINQGLDNATVAPRVGRVL
jgi:cell division septation protein DedD